MGFYAEQIVPRCVDFLLSRPPILEVRARSVQGLRGDVLEVGFGSGLNLPYYPAEVTSVLAIEPSMLARSLAQPRIEAAKVPVRWGGLDGAALDVPDASVDAALSTFTFCTIPDLAGALRELRRVIRPGGGLHFLEHGRSPEASVARWQDRLNPLQRRLAGGCNLNRTIADCVRDAGFCMDALETYYLPGPRFATYIYEGRARRC
ncbi:MAG TPA: class I SAM-dependent methyltransferase [Polyangiales bacterium]|nr:class I SAM-dependent methyltransferase [Polyangiales bacterium]